MIISQTARENKGSVTHGKKYQVEMMMMEKCDWTAILETFSDAGIYQTHEYGEVSKGGSRLTHVLLREEGVVVAAAQIRIQTAHKINRGIAYVFHGPLWRRWDIKPDAEHLRQILGALKTEFAVNQKLLLRIVPKCYLEDEQNESDVFSGLEFRKTDSPAYRTVYMDLSKTIDEIRASLSRNWRRHLNRSEKKGLSVREGTEDQLFEIFENLYGEMIDRKNFYSPLEVKNFRRMQKKFDAKFKMKIMICEDAKGPVAGIVGTGIGETGIYLLGATSTRGLSSDGSYLLHWEMIKWLKDQGCRWYDLGGVDPVRNPGGYQFKEGMRGQEINFIGTFEYCENTLSKIIVKSAERIKKVTAVARW
ncbi:MAG: lipid II:glycine glycyltransferase FemX [Calditrichaceae bacterium]